MPHLTRRRALAAAIGLALAPAGCAGFRQAGAVGRLSGVITLDRSATPVAVYVEDPKEGRWRLEGNGLDDLRELDRARVEVVGLGEPRDPRQKAPGTFAAHAYRLVEVGGRPALVGRLAWEGADLLLVELDRDDRRVALAGPLVGQLPSLMGKSIWVAGQARQGVFVVERYGVLRQ
jgi:hypothetical protein